MSQFSFENEIRNVLRMDAPITKAPVVRWQRKLNESSFNTSRNDSVHMTPMAKTPKKSVNASSSAVLNPKTPTNKGLFKTPHKTPGKEKKTPGKGSKTPSASDRFIPNRASTQFELGHYLLTNQKVDENDASAKSDPQKEYQQAMNENLNGDAMQNKIISYRPKPPSAPEGFQKNLNVLYSTSNVTSSVSKVTRHIPQAPERILDAPEMLNDYYLNLIDWSCNNHLAVSLGAHVYVWNAGTGEIDELMNLQEADEYISSVAWVKEGNYLAVGTSPGAVQLWDVERQKRLRTMTGHPARVGALAWNNHILTSGSRTGYIHHHDVRVPEHLVGSFAGHSQEVCGLKWSPDGMYLASGGNDNLLNIWQARAGLHYTNSEALHTFGQHVAAVKALAWCPWQPHLLASGGGTADRHIRFWNCNTGSCVQSVDTGSQVCSLLWSAEYKELVSSHGFALNQLIIWKYPTMEKVTELTGHTARVLHMAMSPDGTTVVSAAADETLRLWKCFAIDPKKKKQKEKSSAKKNPSALVRQSIR